MGKLRVGLAIGALALVVLALWWVWPEPQARHAGGAQAELRHDASPEERAAEPRTGSTARARAGHRKRPRWSDPQPPTPATSSAAHRRSPASLVEQLVAIHAIKSQADVSAMLEKNAELAAKLVDRFCREVKQAQKRPLFPDGSEERDAAGFMAPLIDWATPSRQGKLHLPEEMSERISAAGREWPAAVTPADRAGLDFGWMVSLLAYDHWSLVQDDTEPIDDPADPSTVFPFPRYPPLMMWARLRLAQGLASGDLSEARREVRHLADLIHSQHILIAEMVALHLVIYDQDILEAAQRRGIAVEALDLPLPADLDALKRLTRTQTSFFYPGVEPEVMRRALDCAPDPCSAINEAIWVHVTVGSMSPTDTSPALWSLAEGRNCDPRIAALVRSGREVPAERAAAMVADEPLQLEKAFP